MAPPLPAAPRPHRSQGFALPSFLQKLGSADAALAFLVVAIVGLMVVPLPTFLLDLLLAANLSIAIAILLVVLYAPDALGIATFPTLLLITTLFRLALGVSSTRLILLQGDAGEVIRAFGHFVVRGNYVVGGVVFLILTIIQFIVIAKGSERVAEVSARFVLDAMPGKQMAIDAEARSGAIDGAEAKRRRRQLARESQFYGAMDGAMKFVKGDVIASLIITVVNILGGLAVGVGQRGMEVEDALKRYGLLTIGDGLVTQIPALVLATAAGILVTRVASEEPDTPLGTELASQVFSTPKAMRVSAVFVVGLAVVPGLPTLPFLAIGGLLFLGSRVRARRIRHDEQIAGVHASPQRGQRRGPVFMPAVVPWSVELSEDFRPLVEDDLRGDEVSREGIRSALVGLRERIFSELGVPLPPPRLHVNDQLPPRSAVLSLFEVPARVIEVEASIPNAEVAEVLAKEAAFLLRKRAADYVGMAEVQHLLDQLEQLAPALVRQVVPKPVSLQTLTDVLRRLVEEQTSIRDLRTILEGLAIVGGIERDPLHLTEFVRGQLRRATTFKLTGGASELSVYLLDPSIEEAIRQSITRTSSGSFLTLPPAAARDVVSAIRRMLASAEALEERAVILTQPDVRRFVHKLIETDLPEVTVVSFAELLPEISLRPLGKATLAG